LEGVELSSTPKRKDARGFVSRYSESLVEQPVNAVSSRRPNINQWAYSLVLVLLGVAFLGYGIWVVSRVCERQFNGVTVAATVERTKGHSKRSYLVEFPVDGVAFQAWTLYVSNGRAGEHIEAVYARNDPSNVAERGSWGTTVLNISAGLLVGAAGILGGIGAWRHGDDFSVMRRVR
jgi:hypothetical protein